MDNKRIGKLISELRKKKGLTQQELGDKVGVGFRAVSKWENGVTLPDISIISELSKVLGINVDQLLCPAGYYSNLDKKTFKKKIKLSIFPENKIDNYKSKHSYKEENYKVLRDIGIAVIVEVIVLNILNELAFKNSIIIATIGFLCIIISDKYSE